jgi:hypothetical protein
MKVPFFFLQKKNRRETCRIESGKTVLVGMRRGGGVTGRKNAVITADFHHSYGAPKKEDSDPHLDEIRFAVAQGQGETQKAQGHGVVKRSTAHALDLHTRNQTHVPDATAHFTIGPDARYNRILPLSQAAQGYCLVHPTLRPAETQFAGLLIKKFLLKLTFSIIKVSAALLSSAS